MKKPRDSQRSRVYAAEGVIQQKAADPAFEELAACQKYVDRIRHSAWFRRHYPGALQYIRLKDGRGSTRARADNATIDLPRWGRQKAVILHELAHCVIRQTYGSRTMAGHGREWAAVYLALVRRWMGREAAAKLKASFQERRVRFRPKRHLSPETRQAAGERLRAVRAAMAAKST